MMSRFFFDIQNQLLLNVIKSTQIAFQQKLKAWLLAINFIKFKYKDKNYQQLEMKKQKEHRSENENENQLQIQIATQDIGWKKQSLNNCSPQGQSQFYLRNQDLSRENSRGLKLTKFSKLIISTQQSEQQSSFRTITSPTSIFSRNSREGKITSIVHSSRSKQSSSSKSKMQWNQVKTNLSLLSRDKKNKETRENSFTKIAEYSPNVKINAEMKFSDKKVENEIRQSFGRNLQKQNALDLAPLKKILKIKKPDLQNQSNLKPNGQNLSKIISQKVLSRQCLNSVVVKMYK